MEAAVEERAPLGVLKKLNVLLTCSLIRTDFVPGKTRWNSTGATDVKGRAVPKGAISAVPPPARKPAFDQLYRSVNRTRHIRRSRGECTQEVAVQFGRAGGSGLDFLQEFPQVHLSYPLFSPILLFRSPRSTSQEPPSRRLPMGHPSH